MEGCWVKSLFHMNCPCGVSSLRWNYKNINSFITIFCRLFCSCNWNQRPRRHRGFFIVNVPIATCWKWLNIPYCQDYKSLWSINRTSQLECPLEAVIWNYICIWVEVANPDKDEKKVQLLVWKIQYVCLVWWENVNLKTSSQTLKLNLWPLSC